MHLVLKKKDKKGRYYYVYSEHNNGLEFDTIYQKREYWKEEIKRWKHGWNGLTGFQYFYLQEWILKDNSKDNQGKPIRPIWRKDDEDIFFKPLDNCLKNSLDLTAYKRREAAWSSILSGFAVWAALTDTGSNIGYTSADVDRIIGFFRDKLEYGIIRMTLPTDVLGFKFKISYSKTTCKCEIWDDSDSETRKDVSIIDGFDTIKNPKSFEGARYKAVLIDEMALHNKLDELYGSCDSSRKKGQIRTGIIVMGGTAGTIKLEVRKKLLELLQSAKTLRITNVFYLGYHGNFEIAKDDGSTIKVMENGYTDHELCKSTYLEERTKLYALPNKRYYWELFYAFPLETHEIFEATDQSNLPEDIRFPLKEQEQLIKRNEIANDADLLIQGSINRINDVIEFSKNGGGAWFIFEQPKPNDTYIMGTDPIDFSSNNKEGSDFVSLIKSREQQKYVAMFVGRLNDPQVIAENVINGQLYYNRAKNMLEMDRGSALKIFYDQWGYSDLLANTPSELGIKYSKLPNNKGYKALAFGHAANGYVLNYLRKYPSHIFIKRIIEEAYQWGTGKNLDCLDAMRGCELYDNNLIAAEIKNSKKSIVAIEYQGFDENGQLKWFTINTTEDQSQLGYFSE